MLTPTRGSGRSRRGVRARPTEVQSVPACRYTGTVSFYRYCTMVLLYRDQYSTVPVPHTPASDLPAQELAQVATHAPPDASSLNSHTHARTRRAKFNTNSTQTRSLRNVCGCVAAPPRGAMLYEPVNVKIFGRAPGLSVRPWYTRAVRWCQTLKASYTILLPAQVRSRCLRSCLLPAVRSTAPACDAGLCGE